MFTRGVIAAFLGACDSPRVALSAIVFTASLGMAAQQTAASQRVKVVSKSHLDIMSNGKFSGKISLAVGTQLDVDGVDGEYLLVHIHMMHGRVLAKDTDANGAAAAAQAGPPTERASQGAFRSRPQPNT